MGKTHEALEKAEKDYQKHLQRTSRKSLRNEWVTPSFISASNSTNFKRYEDLKANLLARDESVKSILFIDSSRGGGSPTHALNFATALAMDSDLKVLVVDLKLWSFSLNEVFKIDDALGLSDLFSNSGKVASKIMKVGPGNLYTVRWGGNYPGPDGLFESRHFSKFVKMMCERFNYVILDAPPVTSFSECRAICAKVDSVVLVLESGKTGRQVALRAKKQLGKTGEKLLGVVLDRARPLNSQFALIAGTVVVVCLVFTAGLFVGNSQVKLREGGSLATYNTVRIKIESQANSHDQSLAQANRNNYAQTTMLQKIALPSVPQEKINPETRPEGERIHEPQKTAGLSMETKKEEQEARAETVPDKTDESKPEEVRTAVVMRGDTLFKIIDRAYGKYDEGILEAVLRENPGIQSVDRIAVGQIIKLPPLADSS